MRRLLLVSLSLVVLLGCTTAIPTNQVTVSTPQGKFTGDWQKNTEAESIELTVDTSGGAKLKIGKIRGMNDPSVVASGGVSFATQLQAFTDLLNAINNMRSSVPIAAASAPPVPTEMPARSIQLHNPTNWSKHEFDSTTNSAAH